MGDTMTLMTVTADKKPSDRDFLPLFVEYRNKTYAAGKIPGGFFKREARPTERETLSCRLIDRPLRPLFPDGYRHETQVVAFIISADTDFHADTLSITGASAALNLSRRALHRVRLRRARGRGRRRVHPQPQPSTSSRSRAWTWSSPAPTTSSA